MIVTPDIYVPALSWRMGEYQALLRLSEAAKARLKPLLTIPKIEFDFDEWKPRKTVQKHVEPFARRFKAKWKTRPAWVDIHPSLRTEFMDNGLDVFTHVFTELRKFKAEVTPVTSLDASSGALLKAQVTVVQKDGKGLALRVRLEDIMKPDFVQRVDAALAAFKLADGWVDLIIDFGAPTYEPYDAFCVAFIGAMKKITRLDAFRSFVVIGTSFPSSMKGIDTGDDFARHEWIFYKRLVAMMPPSMRRPSFGDYTIVHPNFAPLDMRKIKSAGKIIYATKDRWAIEKGKAFRDNPEQMHGLCARLVASSVFKGKDFSDGDDYIYKCAREEVSPSNQPRWKQVGINHHIMQVLEDLANAGAPA
jgi:hypothetical protein